MSARGDSGAVLRRQARIRLLLAVIALMLLIVAARSVPGQWDATEDKMFTLSKSSRSVLDSLDEPLLIRAFITPDLPQPYGQLQRYLKDILSAYHDAGHGHVGVEFVDPEADPTVAASLEAMGIPRLQLQVIKDDRAEIRQAYLAIVTEYLDKREIIPVVDSDVGFEYKLTTTIKNLLGFVRPKIGVVQAAGARNWEDLRNFRALLQNDYELIPVSPEQEAVPVYIKALVVPGFSSPPPQAVRSAIDQFLSSGKGAMVFAANGVIDDTKPGIHLEPVEEQTHDWLKDYGVSVGPGIVMDAISGRIALNQRQGIQAFRNMVDYPFMVKALNVNQAHPVTRGLESVLVPFAAPLHVLDDEPNDVLLTSSAQTAVQPGPVFDLDPLLPLAERFAGFAVGQENLAIALRGRSSPAYGERTADKPATGHAGAADDIRLMVVGSRAILDDDFIAGGNSLFLLNSMDWLTRSEALIPLRSRGTTQRPLPQLSSTARQAWKWFWMFGMPGFVALAGLWRWWALKRRRSNRLQSTIA